MVTGAAPLFALYLSASEHESLLNLVVYEARYSTTMNINAPCRMRHSFFGAELDSITHFSILPVLSAASVTSSNSKVVRSRAHKRVAAKTTRRSTLPLSTSKSDVLANDSFVARHRIRARRFQYRRKPFPGRPSFGNQTTARLEAAEHTTMFAT